MKHLLVVLSILVLLLFPFQPLNVQAETTDIADFKEFDSFMKRYHEHTAEIAYYVGTSYDSNDHYFRENFQMFRNGINQLYDTNKSEFLTKYLDSAEDLFAKPVALLATSDDIRRLMFDKIKDFFKVNESFHNQDYVMDKATALLQLPDNMRIIFGTDTNKFIYKVGLSLNQDSLSWLFCADSPPGVACGTYKIMTFASYSDAERAVLISFAQKAVTNGFTIDEWLSVYHRFNTNPNHTIRFVSDGNVIDPLEKETPPQIINLYNRVVNEFDSQDRFNKEYVPAVVPQLVCPTGNIPLQYIEGQFETSSGQVLVINPDETVQNGAEICNLDFKFPELSFNPLTGDVVAGVESLLKVPPTNQDDYDYSIVEYVRNSYNYATSVISSGVNGLRSISSGTAGLIGFTGSLFGFLPPEILTLFIGGFSIALGLWVFKK